jgi:hypothetical protein
MVKKKMIADFFDLINGSFTFYKNNKTYDKIIKKFYTEMKLIKKKNIDIQKVKFNPSDLSESHFVSEHARKALKKVKFSNNSTFTILNTTIQLQLLTPKNTTNKQKKNDIQRVYKLLHFILGFSNMNLETLNIVLFLHDDKKYITKKYETLGPNHVNSAVTYACAKNGEIFLYRKEEWFKVLAHELMHSLCLDFSGLNTKILKGNFKKLFKIESKYEISESYAEFWATVINILFISYDITNKYTAFKENVTMMLDIESLFSLYQCIKILKYMKINNYKQFLENKQTNLYEENTNVFAYYFVKTILLYNYDEFMKFCHENNSPGNPILFYKSPGNLNSFFNFVLKYYSTEYLLNDFRAMELILGDIKNPELKKTMRMTLFEKN